MTIEGATDALAFEAYVEHFLAPTLKEGQVVVLDMGWEPTGHRESQGSSKQEGQIFCSCHPTRRS
jgi:hypothetical protein